jgi:hypothetical protein
VFTTRNIRRVIPFVALLGLLALGARSAARLLVVDRPQPSDVLVVLGGDQNDRRFRYALELLHKDYGSTLLVDANTNVVEYGRTPAALEQEFIERTTGPLLGRVKICPNQSDSTDEEARYVGMCLQGSPSRILLVTSDYQTRRALYVFQHRLAQYQWSVAAVKDESAFGIKWWQHRQWAKTTVLEWSKLAWWELVDRWRKQ